MDMPKRKRCTSCKTTAYLLTDAMGRCIRCGSRDFDEIPGAYGPQTIFHEDMVYHGTTCLSLKVHNRRGAHMVTVPIVWDGAQYSATFQGLLIVTLNLGPVFELENAEKIIRREVNREAME